MSSERVKLLDDHITVLQNMVGMLSEELYTAIEERKTLLETLQVVDSMENDESNAVLSCFEKVNEEESGRLGPKRRDGQASRSFSPTSPLDCYCTSTEEVHTIEKLPKLQLSRDSNQMNNKGRNGGIRESFHSEPLPTPRGRTSYQMDAAEDLHPDMNNALSDSDEDDSSAGESHGRGVPHRSRRTHVSSLEFELSKRAKQERTSGPQNWIPNTAFASSVLHMIQPNENEIQKDGENAVHGLTHSVSHRSRRSSSIVPEIARSSASAIAMRSCETELLERASVVPQLWFELRQARLALQEKKVQISVLTEELRSARQVAQEEASHRCRDVKTLHEQLKLLEEKLNDASASKFLLFCKLQTAEAKVKEAEELQIEGMSCSVGTDATTNGMINGVLKHRECSVELFNTIDLSLTAQNANHSKRGSVSPDPFPRKVSSSAICNPLQETLSQTYEQLLRAEKRGDALLQRVRELEEPSQNRPQCTASVQCTSDAKPKQLRSSQSRKSASRIVQGRVSRGTVEHCPRHETRLTPVRVKTSSKQIKPSSKSTRWRF